MADISKIKLANGTTVDIKDAAGRTNFATLLGTNALAALKTAAWKDAQTTWDATKTDELPTTGAVKSYVDSQIESIPTFECVVCPAEAAKIPAGAKYVDKSTTPATEITGTMAASASTYKKIYLVKNDDAQAGAYVEYLTVRSGSEGSYTYSWEQIGSTVIDLSNYVTKTTKIADVEISTGIAKADLQSALDLKALAYKDSATGTVSGQTITGVKATYTPSGDVDVVLADDTAAVATISEKAAYTPSGSLLVDSSAQAAGNKVLKGGTISVTVKDAAAGSDVTDITYEAYTPAGTVALTASETGSFQVAGTNASSAVSFNKSDDTFVKSLKAGTTDAASFNEGAFTPASISEGFFSAGSQASYSHTGFSGGSFTKGTAVTAATEGIVASVGTGDDAETLIFTSAATDNVMDHDASFTAAVYGTDTFTANTLPSIDTTKFDGGSKAADTFSAEKLPVVDASAKALTGLTDVTAAAQVFTGSKFDPAFTGTSADIKMNGAKYLKQEISAATFAGSEATISFSGTESANLIPSKITYVPKKVQSATFTGSAAEASVGNIVVADKDVTVS